MDFNKSESPILEGTVTSGVGLQKINIFVGSTLMKSITSFDNMFSYDFVEAFNYSETMTREISIIAIDRNGKSTTKIIRLDVVPRYTPPEITFPADTLKIDPSALGNTKFTVTSNAGLHTLSYVVLKNDHTTGSPQNISVPDSALTFEFNSLISYNLQKDTALKVTATDIDGRESVVTIPVISSIPPPQVKVTGGYIQADSPGNTSVPISASSNGGLKSVSFYGISRSGETKIKTSELNGVKTLSTTASLSLSDHYYAVKVVVTDVIGQKDSLTVNAAIGLKYLQDYIVGSQYFAAGHPARENTYTLFSVRDLKAYNIDDVIGVSENNIDFKFYMFGGAAVPRLLTMDGGGANKNSEYKASNGKTAEDFTVKNGTRFLTLPKSFSFEEATVSDIKGIDPASITVSNVNPANPGDVIAFKTAATSAAGPDKIGIIKIIDTEVIDPEKSANRGIFQISVKFLND